MTLAYRILGPDDANRLQSTTIGVSPLHRRRGVGRRLIEILLDVGRRLGCHAARVLTDRANDTARRLYVSAGGDERPGDSVVFTFDL